MRLLVITSVIALAAPAVGQSLRTEPQRTTPNVERVAPGINSFEADIDNTELNCTELNDITAVCDCDHEPSAQHAAACRIVLDANCTYHPNDDVWTCPIDPPS